VLWVDSSIQSRGYGGWLGFSFVVIVFDVVVLFSLSLKLRLWARDYQFSSGMVVNFIC